MSDLLDKVLHTVLHKVVLEPIYMLSWKLLAIFHDPIHDFGLNIDRMSSIIKYINNIKDQIKNHESNPTFKDEKFHGGAKRKYALNNEIDTLYIEERNIATIPEVDLSQTQGELKIYTIYKKLYDNYLDCRTWYNNNAVKQTNTVTIDQNQTYVYRLQTYTQFFTNITKLIDLFKFLIVIQVINMHNGVANFSYNNVHKETVITAMLTLSIEIAGTSTDAETEELKKKNEKEVKELSFLLNVMEVIFHTISSRHCLLQLDLLNSSTFNNLVRIFFSCYFYENGEFIEVFGDYVNTADIFTKINKRREVIDNQQEDDTSELSTDEKEVANQYNIEIEMEYEYDAPQGIAEGGGGRRRKFIRPLILKGGAGAKYTKWKETAAPSREVLTNKLKQWNVLKKRFNDHKKDDQWDQIYGLFTAYYNQEDSSWITPVQSIFPIFYNKMKKDLDYHATKVRTTSTRSFNPRTNPMATYCTKMSDYMNELSSEIDALEAEMDNEEKREIKSKEKSDSKEVVDKTVTNQISKLMARKGLEYAKASLKMYTGTVPTVPAELTGCLEYIEIIFTSTVRPQNPTDFTDLTKWHVSYQILIHHIYFLGIAYVQHKNCLPDIDTKLIDYWRVLSKRTEITSRIMTQDALETLTDTQNKKNLRVINNGIPSILKDIFHQYVYCPSSSVCDAMGSFGSCAGNKRKDEFYGMNIHIVNTDESDYYDVFSKIDNKTLEVITNSFILYFPTAGDTVESMVIECRLGGINLEGKPDMLSANNVFKVTLQVIEGILKEAKPMSVDVLWSLLYTSENFKNIITSTCKKATGDINQELNSIVKNGGYYESKIDLQNKYTVGLAGDRPSGVRMALLALFASKDQLLTEYVVGYGNVSDSFLVKSPPPPSRTPPGVKAGGIRKTKFRKPKMIKTRKNKSHHYKMMSKRRKYNNNKTKNRKQ